MPWAKIKKYESCKLLRTNNQLYTIPSALELEYSSWARDGDITWYERGTDKPYLLKQKGWDERGLFITTYYEWVELEEEV